MIDIKFLRENPDIVKQNIKNKFQDHKLGNRVRCIIPNSSAGSG